MQVLIWIGAAVTLIGLGMLISLIRSAMRLRKAGLPEAEARTQLVRLAPLNFGALALSILGLMMVVIGLALS